MKTGSKDITQRKADHIDLAFASQMQSDQRDTRFYYEPMLSGHPAPDTEIPVSFAGRQLRYPIWVSSMTGGTELARTINANLARMCGEFGLGMGLGSCRVLLDRPELLPDFDVRGLIGPDLPLYANLGLAQVEQMLARREEARIGALVEMLKADGLIVHVNPVQEWLQPEGDRFLHAPVETIRQLLEVVRFPVIVKEVGQGMGPESLRSLLSMPLAAIELAAHGGTNFAALELLRDTDEMRQANYGRIAAVGHSAEEMVDYLNQISEEMHGNVRCKQIIVSGGVKDFLDGFYLTKKLTLPAIYGHASGFLKYAQESYTELQAFARIQTRGLALAHAYLRVK